LLQEEILDPDIGYNCWYAIDIPEENSFMITAVPYIFKCDYDFNIEWIENEGLLPYYKKMDFGYLLYSNGVHLIRTDENIVSISDDVIQESLYKFSIFPNPINSETTFSFNLPKNFNDGFVNIYNIKGQRVKQFSINKNISEIIWDGTDQSKNELSSGIYFATIFEEDRTLAVKKITLIK
ncbi:MAG: T9SS type A sorting domain-containing protein, partial [Candidatus Cloacimonetes bacterium]|nr:T9SS type A sorting domain-containing protein [Candidatus Cloacimonadota bacterium]